MTDHEINLPPGVFTVDQTNPIPPNLRLIGFSSDTTSSQVRGSVTGLSHPRSPAR